MMPQGHSEQGLDRTSETDEEMELFTFVKEQSAPHMIESKQMRMS